jgi:hypothetical protein
MCCESQTMYRGSYNRKGFAVVSISVVAKDLRLYGCECYGIAKALDFARNYGSQRRVFRNFFIC